MFSVRTDHPMVYHGTPITIPQGTVVQPHKDGLGHTIYAVRDAALVKRLTGDTHTPTYYYCWVSGDVVEEYP